MRRPAGLRTGWAVQALRTGWASGPAGPYRPVQALHARKKGDAEEKMREKKKRTDAGGVRQRVGQGCGWRSQCRAGGELGMSGTFRYSVPPSTFPGGRVSSGQPSNGVTVTGPASAEPAAARPSADRATTVGATSAAWQAAAEPAPVGV